MRYACSFKVNIGLRCISATSPTMLACWKLMKMTIESRHLIEVAMDRSGSRRPRTECHNSCALARPLSSLAQHNIAWLCYGRGELGTHSGMFCCLGRAPACMQGQFGDLARRLERFARRRRFSSWRPAERLDHPRIKTRAWRRLGYSLRPILTARVRFERDSIDARSYSLLARSFP